VCHAAFAWRTIRHRIGCRSPPGAPDTRHDVLDISWPGGTLSCRGCGRCSSGWTGYLSRDLLHVPVEADRGRLLPERVVVGQERRRLSAGRGSSLRCHLLLACRAAPPPPRAFGTDEQVIEVLVVIRTHPADGLLSMDSVHSRPWASGTAWLSLMSHRKGVHDDPRSRS